MELGTSSSGIIFDIKKFAIHDGPGIRTTIFLKGCPLTCWWCHNPESREFAPETILESPLIPAQNSGLPTTYGRDYTVQEVMQEIEKDRVFYEESGGGVTFSGGEPLSQPEFLLHLLKACKEKAIFTTLDTTGYAEEWILDRIDKWVDLYLYDLKFIDDTLHQKYTGVSNKIILSNLRKLSKNHKKIIIRIPIIPSINDSDEEIDRMCDFISSLHMIQGIDLLPFHKIGKTKWKKLHFHYKMENFFEPSAEDMHDLKKKFEALGYPVKIGG